MQSWLGAKPCLLPPAGAGMASSMVCVPGDPQPARVAGQLQMFAGAYRKAPDRVHGFMMSA